MKRAAKRAGWGGRRGQRSEAELEGSRNRLVVLHGLGELEEFDLGSVAAWTRRVGAELRSRGATSALIVPPDLGPLRSADGIEAFLRRLSLADYRCWTGEKRTTR